MGIHVSLARFAASRNFKQRSRRTLPSLLRRVFSWIGIVALPCCHLGIPCRRAAMRGAKYFLRSVERQTRVAKLAVCGALRPLERDQRIGRAGGESLRPGG